jgi:reactive intermediate/imine deaminase
VWLSGQIPLIPATMELVTGDIQAQARQVFSNLAAVAEAAGGTLNSAVKINISLTDMGDFAAVNEVMTEFLQAPFPARACVQVAGLPRGVAIEVEAILAL